MKFRFRRYYLYYLGRVLAFKFSLLPIRVGLCIAGILGTLAFYALPRYRRIAIENLNLAFAGEKTPHQIRKIAKDMFKNLAMNALEMVNFRKINKSNIGRFVSIKNSEIAKEAYRKGKGIVVITAHIGNWELMASALRLNGYPGAAVGRRIYFDKYDKYLNSLRRLHDVEIVYRDESPRKALKILRENKILGVVADQDVDSVDGVFVNFFGRPAYTPVGPVALAKASGAPLVPTFIVRTGPGRHTLVFEKPIELVDTGDRGRDIVINTQKWSDVVESYIRQYPDQWVWLHRRWKTKKAKN